MPLKTGPWFDEVYKWTVVPGGYEGLVRLIERNFKSQREVQMENR